MSPSILVIDAGTTSVKAMLFGVDGQVTALAGRPLRQIYPRPGWVEHDPSEIWQATLSAIGEVRGKTNDAPIAAIGIANQRETIVAWDRRTSRPLTNAIVWQDRRTSERCDQLRAAGVEPRIRERTGLLLDPYFTATKIDWLLNHCDAIKTAGSALALGTIDSWLLWQLTGGAVHATDGSNASRTMLMALDGAGWDEQLCDLFHIDPSWLPRVVDSLGLLGETQAGLLGEPLPICGMAGDQQAATIGQGCLAVGDTKATFGTGAFVLTNCGDTPLHSDHRLLATVLCQQAGKRSYALEGSIFAAGSLMQWLRDSAGLLVSAPESEILARSVPNSGGVVMVPALSGLGAPHWRPDALGAIHGISFATGRAHLVRAALEAQAHQVHDLMTAFEADGIGWQRLRIDGGMAANSWLAQDLADILDLPVERPQQVETTALGAAMLAAVGAGLFNQLDEAAAAMGGPVERFDPQMSGRERERRLGSWREALAKL